MGGREMGGREMGGREMGGRGRGTRKWPGPPELTLANLTPRQARAPSSISRDGGRRGWPGSARLDWLGPVWTG